MFGIIKKMHIVLLSSKVDAYNIQNVLGKVIKNVKFNLLLLTYILMNTVKNFTTYPFSIKLNRFVGSWNTLNDLSNKLCIPNKTEDLKLSVFNMITRVNESKTLTKDISCKCKCKFDSRDCNLNQWWNNNKCWCECKKISCMWMYL